MGPGVRAWLAAVLSTALFATPAGGDELGSAQRERQSLQDQLSTVTAELDALAVRVSDAEHERGRLESDVAALTAAARASAVALRTRAVHAYVHGQPGVLGVALTSQDVNAMRERARLLAAVGEADAATIERADVARTSLRSRRARLDELLVQLAADKARVAALRAELAGAFQLAQAREAELASRRFRQREVSRGRMRGTYACPIGAPYTFRDTWGDPRSGGRSHKGVDLFAPMGADVYAITNGTIARPSSSRLGGLGLYVAGDDGNLYYYAHLQVILPGYGPGRRVEAGELIARNGDSGNASGGAAHVHFEVRPGGGGPVNPYPFTAAACF